MAILIKGMEMPDNCEDCPLVQTDENYYGDIMSQRCNLIYKGYLPEAGKRPDCPLIEIPEPHGRLGDLDELEKRIKYVANLEWNQKVGASGGMLAALELVSDTQAIIPATSEGET